MHHGLGGALTVMLELAKGLPDEILDRYIRRADKETKVLKRSALGQVDDPIFAAEQDARQVWAWKKIGQHTHDGQMLARHHQIGDIDGDGFADRRWLMGTPQGQCEAQIKFPDRDPRGKIHPVNGRLVCR